MLAKCLQVLEIHHLKNNSSGDFLYFKMLQEVSRSIIYYSKLFSFKYSILFFRISSLDSSSNSFCVSSLVNNRNYVLEVDSKHILFDHSRKSRLVSWQFSLINFRGNPKTPKKKGEMENVKDR